MTDRPVRVQAVVNDWVTDIPCESVELTRDPPGFILLFEPLALDQAYPGEGLTIDGKDVLVVNLDDVVSVEGDIDQLGPFLRGDDGV